MHKLDALAASGSEFAMDPLCTNLTFDIIGEVVTNIDLKAQDDESGAHEIVQHFRSVLGTFSDTGRLWLWLNVPVRIRRLYYSRLMDQVIKKFIREKFDAMKKKQNTTQSIDTKQVKDRSVLGLALQDIDVLTDENLQLTADQVKSFFFAGHDTTSILLQVLFYLLSIDPKRLATIRSEHDAVFGEQDPREVFQTKPEETLKALPYTSACIKETLRLWPPAGSARLSSLGTGFKVSLEDGQELCLDGTILYLNHYLIQRDPSVYGETANDFVPERWLGENDTKDTDDAQAGANKIPTSAWRPFERGPRNCIGQELANIEARVILACVIRRYDFIKVGAGEIELNEKGEPMLNENGVYRTKSELFTSSVITARPFDGCRMKIKMHNARG